MPPRVLVNLRVSKSVRELPNQLLHVGGKDDQALTVSVDENVPVVESLNRGPHDSDPLYSF